MLLEFKLKRIKDKKNILNDENEKSKLELKKLKQQNNILVEYNNELQNKVEDLLKWKSNHICNKKCN